MEFNIAQDDADGFESACRQVLDRFVVWAQRQLAIDGDLARDLASDARLALDWKWSYRDGQLGLWRATDIREFLLEWCPRKLGVSPEEAEAIPVALSAFMAFLDQEALLAPKSSPPVQLIHELEDLSEEFLTSMGDRSKFGVSKSLMTAATDAGFDITSSEDIEAWMDRFNALPEEERRRLIPDSAFGSSPRLPALPPVVMPDDGVVDASKADAPILVMFREFAAFVGTGRKLTQKGNLTLADARTLVDLLGTGDVMDEVIGDHTFKTVSSDDLPRLRLIFAWAKKAGILRVVHGKVVATKRGIALGRDVGTSFDRTVDALMAMGPLSAQRYPDAWLAWPDVDTFIDELSVHMLIAPYGAHEPVPIAVVVGTTTEAVLEDFEFRLPDEEVGKVIEGDVIDVIDAFELAGLVRRIDTSEPQLYERRRPGGAVAITAAGVFAVRRILEAAGHDTPVAGGLAHASATELLLGTDQDDFEVMYAEVLAWRRARTPEEAVAQLADAVRHLEDVALQNLALALMADVGVDIATPHVHELALKPKTRGFALCWLVDHDLADKAVLFDAADADTFVDVLAHRMATRGPEEFLETLSMVGDHGDQISVVDRLWRAPSAATEMVLSVIAEEHPSKAVAKAARKALFKRRSSYQR